MFGSFLLVTLSLVFFDVTGSLASFSKIYLPNAQTSKTLASLSAALLCEDAAPWTRSPFPRRQPSHSHPAEMLYVVLLPFHRAGCYKDVITGQDLSEITMVSALLKTSLQKHPDQCLINSWTLAKPSWQVELTIILYLPQALCTGFFA